jgi:hypothetical protein
MGVETRIASVVAVAAIPTDDHIAVDRKVDCIVAINCEPVGAGRRDIQRTRDTGHVIVVGTAVGASERIVVRGLVDSADSPGATQFAAVA